MSDHRQINPPGFEGYVDDWQMSPGLVANGFLFLTGMTGHFADKPGAPPTPEDQARIAFERVAAVLEEAGCGWSDVVEMTSYHVDIHETLPSFRTVRARVVTQPFPAWTAIGVAALATPGVMHEVRVVARVPDTAPYDHARDV
ncbi:RidA family protein [Sulfitobacter aestuariivivens]|uniref:RidA family protein n=1 Tax=Sulfitobacter aestuariivivens TaxID=2766981 RepID=A0A927D5L0_9RHOB|nr:RidA family protein [Sulfitobacter aestuariivivens]MBD3664244.1 RidA family protein [Sulfitobacter aestuariivivens]